MKRILSLLLLAALTSACQGPAPAPVSSGTPSNSVSTPSPEVSATLNPPVSSSPSPALVGELQADLQTEKPSYRVGEKIKVTVIAMGLTDSAWVWMVPEEFEVKPTAQPTDSAHPAPTVGTNSALELEAGKPGRYQLYLFPSAEMSGPIASRAVEVTAP